MVLMLTATSHHKRHRLGSSEVTPIENLVRIKDAKLLFTIRKLSTASLFHHRTFQNSLISHSFVSQELMLGAGQVSFAVP